MFTTLRNASIGALCVATALAVAPVGAVAGPVGPASESGIGLPSPIATVHYRRYHHRRYHHRYYRRYGYDPGGAMFAGAALGLMGAGVAAASRPHYYYYGDPYGYGYGYPGPYYGGW